MRTFKRSRSGYPDGVLAIYENRKTIDRYTVVFTPEVADGVAWFTTLHMSESLEYCQHGQYSFRPTRAQGDRVIDFDALPAGCRAAVESDLREMAGGAA